MANNFWPTNAQTQQMNGGSMIVFISNNAEAMNYPIAPGYTVALINANDPNDGRLFIRSSEANGMPKAARVFSIKEITQQQQNVDAVSHKDFDGLSQQVAMLSMQFQQMLDGMKAMQTQPATKGGKKS